MYKIVLLSYLRKFIIVDQIAMDSNKPKSRTITGVDFAYIYFATVSQNAFFVEFQVLVMCSLFFP